MEPLSSPTKVRVLLTGLLVAGAGFQWISPFTWPWLAHLINEMGVALVVAAILGLTVDWALKAEFARDVFRAAFSYVIPSEFKNEVAKILTYDFMAEKHLWKVQIKKVDDETVLVTCSIERTLRNRTSLRKMKGNYLQAYEWHFKNGRTEILECSVKNEDGAIENALAVERSPYQVETRTKEFMVLPNRTVEIWSKSSQYRRISGEMYETFLTPALNPEIEVEISDEFHHEVEFGAVSTTGKEKYTNRTRLDGVYFPGQFMMVRWWPKAPGV